MRKKIDWTKPLCTTARGISATVVAVLTDDERVVTWRWRNQNFVAHVDAFGKRLADTIYAGFGSSISGIGGQLVENVPEEPKDHLHLYRYKTGGKWAIDGDPQLDTKSAWEEVARDVGRTMVSVIVKVPV